MSHKRHDDEAAKAAEAKDAKEAKEASVAASKAAEAAKPDATITGPKPYEEHKQDLIAKGSMNAPQGKHQYDPNDSADKSRAEKEAKEKAPQTLFDKVNAAVTKIGLIAREHPDGTIHVGNDDKPVLKVLAPDSVGVVRFESLIDQDCTGVKAGQVLEPSDQENLAEHAATTARDMFRRW